MPPNPDFQTTPTSVPPQLVLYGIHDTGEVSNGPAAITCLRKAARDSYGSFSSPVEYY